jgi:hypothetical protein
MTGLSAARGRSLIGRLPESVLAGFHRVDAELAQAGVGVRRRVDGMEDRVDRAVARERANQLLAVVPTDTDRTVWRGTSKPRH